MYLFNTILIEDYVKKWKADKNRTSAFVKLIRFGPDTFEKRCIILF